MAFCHRPVISFPRIESQGEFLMPEIMIDPDESLWHWLTHDVRFYRQKYNLTQYQLATIVSSSPSTNSNIEARRRKLTAAQALPHALRIKTGGHFCRLLRFARRGLDPDWFKQYADQETRARLIKAYEAITIPGLLQVPEYAAALFQGGGVTALEG